MDGPEPVRDAVRLRGDGESVTTAPKVPVLPGHNPRGWPHSAGAPSRSERARCDTLQLKLRRGSTMTDKSALGIPVDDLETSAGFYRDVLGFPVDSSGAPGTALVEVSGRRYLLASLEAGDISDHLVESAAVLRPGDVIFVGDRDLEGRRARLATQGNVDVRDLARPWGDYGFEVDDPSGYRVQFWAIIDRTPREVLALYRQGRDGLRAAIGGMDSDDLNWRRAGTGWSIREIIHHVADSEVTVLAAVRVALAEPGREYLSNPYDQDRWAKSLQYARRDVEPSLRLFEAIRDQICQLIETVPDAWSRYLVTKRGGETSVGDYVQMLAVHALEHLEQIDEIRRASDSDRGKAKPDERRSSGLI
jgi:catechol 2,3-dioxygenase-like lactoylglutathione lyase family enzyme